MIYSPFGSITNDDGTPRNAPYQGAIADLANETVSTQLVSGGASKNYVKGDSGWTINNDGYFEAETGNFRGDITGSSGNFSGTLSGATGYFIDSLGVGKTGYTDDTAGFWVGEVGGVAKMYLGIPADYVKWDGSALSILGTLTGSTYKTAEPGASTNSAVVIEGGSNKLIQLYFNAAQVGYIQGLTTTDSDTETEYMRIENAVGKGLRFRNSNIGCSTHFNPTGDPIGGPTENYDLGSGGHKWRDFYGNSVKINTIFIGPGAGTEGKGGTINYKDHSGNNKSFVLTKGVATSGDGLS